MEATGHYWLSVYSFLFEKSFLLHVINPIQTDGWRRGTEIRKRKNDIIDSVLIADLIRYGQFVETRLADEDLFSLRTLTRFRTYLVESISDLKRKVSVFWIRFSQNTSPSFPTFSARPQKKSFSNFLRRLILNPFHLKPWRNCWQSSADRKLALRKRNS